jgi:hypothetical protein
MSRIAEVAVAYLSRALEERVPSFFRVDEVVAPIIDGPAPIKPRKPVKVKSRGHRRRHKRHTRSIKRKNDA